MDVEQNAYIGKCFVQDLTDCSFTSGTKGRNNTFLSCNRQLNNIDLKVDAVVLQKISSVMFFFAVNKVIIKNDDRRHSTEIMVKYQPHNRRVISTLF